MTGIFFIDAARFSSVGKAMAIAGADLIDVRDRDDRRRSAGVAAVASLVRGYTATQAGYLRFCTVDWIVGLSQAP